MYNVILLESIILCVISFSLLKPVRLSTRYNNDIKYKLSLLSSSLSTPLSSTSNTIDSVTLYVKDINKATSFYSNGIGLKQVHADEVSFSLLENSLIKLKQITLLDAVDVGDVRQHNVLESHGAVMNACFVT